VVPFQEASRISVDSTDVATSSGSVEPDQVAQRQSNPWERYILDRHIYGSEFAL
jgi:hypothetical protein